MLRRVDKIAARWSHLAAFELPRSLRPSIAFTDVPLSSRSTTKSYMVQSDIVTLWMALIRTCGCIRTGGFSKEWELIFVQKLNIFLWK